MTGQEAFTLLVQVTGQLQMTRADHDRVAEALRVINTIVIDNDKRKESKNE